MIRVQHSPFRVLARERTRYIPCVITRYIPRRSERRSLARPPRVRTTVLARALIRPFSQSHFPQRSQWKRRHEEERREEEEEEEVEEVEEEKDAGGGEGGRNERYPGRFLPPPRGRPSVAVVSRVCVCVVRAVPRDNSARGRV